MTKPPPTAVWQSALDRNVAMQLAATEYQRVVDLLQNLQPADWQATTDCPKWDVRATACHLLGMVDFARSLRLQRGQLKKTKQRGGVFIDALTDVQVEERAGLSPAQIVGRFATYSPKATAARRRTPGFIRRRTMPVPQTVNGREESWKLGFLIDVILTRDPWMHRIDIVRATGAPHVLTAEHDGVLVADVVREWADRHQQPYTLRLTGPAGGSWSAGEGGEGGEVIEMDAIEFCRALSGRGHGEGLLATEVPF